MTPSLALFLPALVSLLLLAVQLWSLRRHVATPRGEPGRMPPVSVLKPLCGVDDGLWENLASFAALDHPAFEVLLGVRDDADPAWPVAAAAVARWPDRFRLVRQRGSPGLNPKVNQLITLARAARHDVLVISDSNVRVRPGYLREIAWHLQAEEVGLVTHPVVGVGERSVGALFENLHMTASVGPGVVAAKRLAGRDVVVGKSMALRRRDLARLGGFESVKDVLAEDYVLGVRVARELGKRVALATSPVENVNTDRPVGGFVGRYRRWCVMQRMIAGRAVYSTQALLNPVPFALLAAAIAPGWTSLALLLGVCASKAGLDAGSAHAMTRSRFGWGLALVPVKDVLFAVAWTRGFLESSVEWRGRRLRVLPGSRLQAPEGAAAAGVLATDP
jgi:ceramide glucosyltransferase